MVFGGWCYVDVDDWLCVDWLGVELYVVFVWVYYVGCVEIYCFVWCVDWVVVGDFWWLYC